ncbi:hypothetical protein BDR26DRAFT_897136 [Obelidium mucronatum]|nr:hypothetical protein BDR26DRAFT_897136 [Obelidium mucronatum]
MNRASAGVVVISLIVSSAFAQNLDAFHQLWEQTPQCGQTRLAGLISGGNMVQKLAIICAEDPLGALSKTIDSACGDTTQSKDLVGQFIPRICPSHISKEKENADATEPKKVPEGDISNNNDRKILVFQDDDKQLKQQVDEIPKVNEDVKPQTPTFHAGRPPIPPFVRASIKPKAGGYAVTPGFPPPIHPNHPQIPHNINLTELDILWKDLPLCGRTQIRKIYSSIHTEGNMESPPNKMEMEIICREARPAAALEILISTGCADDPTAIDALPALGLKLSQHIPLVCGGGDGGGGWRVAAAPAFGKKKAAPKHKPHKPATTGRAPQKTNAVDAELKTVARAKRSANAFDL